jgi:hypothetical protein
MFQEIDSTNKGFSGRYIAAKWIHLRNKGLSGSYLSLFQAGSTQVNNALKVRYSSFPSSKPRNSAPKIRYLNMTLIKCTEPSRSGSNSEENLYRGPFEDERPRLDAGF